MVNIIINIPWPLLCVHGAGAIGGPRPRPARAAQREMLTLVAISRAAVGT